MGGRTESSLYRLIQIKEEKEKWEEELNHLSVTPTSAKEMEPRTALRQVLFILLLYSEIKKKFINIKFAYIKFHIKLITYDELRFISSPRPILNQL